MTLQIDLRDDAGTIEKLAKNKQKPLSLEMGEKLAKELRAVKYVECSALTQVRKSEAALVLRKGKYHCTSFIYLFGFSCFAYDKLTCRVKSKPVKQEATVFSKQT